MEMPKAKSLNTWNARTMCCYVIAEALIFLNMPPHVSFIRNLMNLPIITSPPPLVLSISYHHHSQMALRNHAALESLTTLKLLPPIHSTNFNADELLVRILRPKISHGLRLLNPRVPHNGVFEVVADDVEARLAVLQHGGGVLLDGLVDAVGLAGDLDRRVGLSVFGCVEDFVGVGRAAQAVDLDLGDVL
jgi:hypothetical protein